MILRKRISIKILIFYTLIYLLTCFISVFFGSVDLFDIMKTDTDIYSKILQIRISNLILVSFVGSCLSICGNVLQNVLKNPLADPFILGISSGGTCFAAACLLFISTNLIFEIPVEASFSIQTFSAFVGCLTSFSILFYLRRRISNFNDDYIYPIIGIIINSFFSAIIMFLFAIAKPEKFSEVQNFLMGSIQPISYLEFFLIFIVCVFPIYKLFNLSNFFSIILFGDDFSKTMGINPEKVRKECIFYVCIIISVVVSVAGIISFIGLIVPHVVRKIHRVDHRSEMLICMLIGAIILVNSDTLARTILKPAQLPVGIFTAIIGAPFLAMILLKRHKI